MNSKKPAGKFAHRHEFQAIAELAADSLRCPVHIWFYEDNFATPRLEAASDFFMTGERLTAAVDDLHVMTGTLKKGKPIVGDNIFAGDVPRDEENAEVEPPKSAIIHPLMIKRKLVGMLEIVLTAKAFQKLERLRPGIEQFANHIAFIHRQRKSFETLDEVTRLMNADIQDRDKLFKSILLATQKILDCENVSIFVLDRESGDLILEETSSIDIKRKRFKPGEGLAGRVAKSALPLLVDDVRKFSDFVPGMNSPERKERSMVLAPVMLKGDAIGVISADSHILNGFDNHDRDLLELLSNQSATAIRNAGLFQRVHQQTSILAELNQITHSFVSIEGIPDTEKLLREVAERAKDALEADLVELYVYEQEKGEYRLPQITAGALLQPWVRKKIFANDAVFKLIERKQPLYEKDAQSPDSIFTGPFPQIHEELPDERFVIREKIKSVAAIPLRTKNEAIGLMFANYRISQGFDNQKRGSIELFANQAAIVIRNMILFEKLNETGAYLNNIIVSSPNPIIVLDEDGNVKTFNKEAEKLLGYSGSELQKLHVARIYKSYNIARGFGKKLWKSQDYRVENEEGEVRTREGKFIPIGLSASLLFDENKKRIGSIGVFTDLRPQKRLQAQMVQAEQISALGKVAHKVGHDIKHNIATILFYLDTLIYRCDPEQEPKLFKIYTNMKEALWDASDKLQDMLMAGRPETPDKKEVAVRDIFGEIEEKMARQARDLGIEFRLHYPHRKQMLFVDVEQMRHVFMNLFNNSVDAIETRKKADGSSWKPKIALRMEFIDDHILFTWKDNGSGIALDAIPNVFNAFFTQKQSGTGLGLFIAKTIVENHGGEIKVQSGKGEGTFFEISLPIAKKDHKK